MQPTVTEVPLPVCVFVCLSVTAVDSTGLFFSPEIPGIQDPWDCNPQWAEGCITCLCRNSSVGITLG